MENQKASEEVIRQLQADLDAQRAREDLETKRANVAEKRAAAAEEAIELLGHTGRCMYWDWLEQALNMPFDVACLPFPPLKAEPYLQYRRNS